MLRVSLAAAVLAAVFAVLSALNGGLVTGVGNTWHYDHFTGKVGDSDLAGRFDVDRSRQRLLVDADLVSQSLNYKDLGGLIGLPPAAETPRQKKQASNPESSVSIGYRSLRSGITTCANFAPAPDIQSGKRARVRPTAKTRSTPGSRRHSRSTPWPTSKATAKST